MFRGLIFHSNEKMSCYFCISSASLFPMRSRTLVFFSPTSQSTALGSAATSDNLHRFRKHSERACCCPRRPLPLPEGDKADTSPSPERRSRDPLRRGSCVSLIMTLFQRRSCLSCHSHAELLISLSPLHPPCALPSLGSVFQKF